MNIFNKIYLQSKYSNKKILLDNTLSYNDFHNLIHEYFNFLKFILKKKKIICIDSKYSIDLLAMVIAARLNQNPLCIFNSIQTESEKNNIIKQVNCSLILSDTKNKKMKKINNFYYELKKNRNILSKDDAFLVFTSGTTSKPKGAILTNNSIKNNVLGIIKQLDFKSHDRTIIYTPPNYAMGISQMITFLYLKCSFLLDNQGIRFADEFLSKIKKYKISILNLNVASFKYLKIFKKHFRLPFLKIVMSGGMKMTKLDSAEIFEFFKNKFIVNFYGCTENSPRVCHFKFTNNQLKKISNTEIIPVGKALKGTRIYIKKNKDNWSENYGEINLSGNSLMRGYLDFKSKKKKINYFNTKDIGYISPEKNLYVIGRTDNIFKSGNEKISPEEIEEQLRHYLKIKNFVIIKRKHAILNWEPVLVIEGSKIKSENKLLTDIGKRISNFKVPKQIYYLKKLFRNNYGKIDRLKIYNYISQNDH